jgi:GrpB-like predicted nucleotidyltransferase (UPF0157 family)
MAYEQETLNGYDPNPDVDAGSSPADYSEASSGADTDTGDEGDTSQKTDSDSDRFDKHPRFQQLIADKNQMAQELAELRGQLAGITQMQGKQGGDEKKDKPYIDITTLEPEKVREWQDEDPIGFHRNVAMQQYHEIMERVEKKQDEYARKVEAQTTQAKKEAALKDWVNKNPEFTKKYNSGELQKFISANPLYDGNLIGAYHALEAQKQMGKVCERLEQAVANKQGLRPLTNAPPRKVLSPEKDDRLKNPAKYGGANAVLYQRMLERRGN